MRLNRKKGAMRERHLNIWCFSTRQAPRSYVSPRVIKEPPGRAKSEYEEARLVLGSSRCRLVPRLFCAFRDQRRAKKKKNQRLDENLRVTVQKSGSGSFRLPMRMPNRLTLRAEDTASRSNGVPTVTERVSNVIPRERSGEDLRSTCAS